MKICYLILAHNNFNHLQRLIGALDDKDSTFYIHIDKKTGQGYKPTSPREEVIPTAIDINWGGFGMVEATLALMNYGMTHNGDTDYFILLSGVDYPVRPRDFLYNQLLQGKEYIDIAPVPLPYKPKERYEHYFFDFKRRDAKLWHPLIMAEALLKKLRIKRKPPFSIYAGTQWFALTSGCVQYILRTVKEDKRYIQFFRHTLIPDEAFFQTIIGNSPWLEQTRASLTYTDWEVPVPPATISQRHIDFLKEHIEFNDEYGQRFPYFARKFDDNSANLLQRIRKELW